MRTVNLYLLTRITDRKLFARYEQSLSGRTYSKFFNIQEIQSLRCMVDALLQDTKKCSNGAIGSSEERAAYPTPPEERAAYPASPDECAAHPTFSGKQSEDPVPAIHNLDGFVFSYTIEHIGKEFDLLKFARGERGVTRILNIELKSENVGEDRILKQLRQNRYYLGHITKRIYSYTYISDTGTLYCMGSSGRLRRAPLRELQEILCRPEFSHYVKEHIGDLFQESDYLISPVNTPERFLAGEYFLTNQQADFREEILEEIRNWQTQRQPFSPLLLSLVGSTGTGKTLVLFDLAMELSRKRKVLMIHCGPLSDGHRIIDAAMKNLVIFSSEDLCLAEWPAEDRGLGSPVDLTAGGQPTVLGSPVDPAATEQPSEPSEVGSPKDPAAGEQPADNGNQAQTLENLFPASDIPLDHFSYLLVDESAQLTLGALTLLMALAEKNQMACLFSYNPNITGTAPAVQDFLEGISLRYELSGNIRVNRAVAMFVRAFMNNPEKPRQKDFRCIELNYASSSKECRRILEYRIAAGFCLLPVTKQQQLTYSEAGAPDAPGHEFDDVLVVIGPEYFYNERGQLRVRTAEGTDAAKAQLSALSNAMYRARKHLSLVFFENPTLFAQVLRLKE